MLENKNVSCVDQYIEVTLRDGTRKKLEAQFGISVMEVLRDNGIDELLAICGGCKSCATCHVYVDDPYLSKLAPMAGDEDDLLDGSDYRAANSRLSCQIEFSAELNGIHIQIAPEH